ncbi:MAG: TolC family protein [Bacteroidales bacterium]|nr:TolC family protein [Bacteroidales bacterium]
MNKTTLILIFGIVCNMPIYASAQSIAEVPLSIETAEQKMRENNWMLQSKDYYIQQAESELRQAKIIDNPQIGFQHNVYNPLTKKYFDTGYDGETDIQIEQPIYIGGQRRANIRKQQSVVESQKAQKNNTERELAGYLYNQFFNLYFTQQKLAIYDKQIASVAKILEAYSLQAQKGNIPLIEVKRIEAMKFALLQEQNELNAYERNLQSQIRLLIGDSQPYNYKPDVQIDKIMDNIQKQYIGSELIATAGNRADIISLTHHIEANEHEIKYQKSQALPKISITGEWDKNGSICHNFFGIGFSASVPIFNRNQGNIKAAKIQYEQTKLEMETKKREVNAEIDLLTQQLAINKQLAMEADKNVGGNFDETILGVEQQFIKRNISLLEFLDLYEAYKDAFVLRIEAFNNLITTAIDLNTAVGENIIRLKNE